MLFLVILISHPVTLDISWFINYVWMCRSIVYTKNKGKIRHFSFLEKFRIFFLHVHFMISFGQKKKLNTIDSNQLRGLRSHPETPMRQEGALEMSGIFSSVFIRKYPVHVLAGFQARARCSLKAPP